MATNIDLYLDAKGSGLLIGGSAQGGALPDLFRNDIYNFRLRVLEEGQDGERFDSVLESPSFKLGIGNLDEGPTIGTFQLTLAGPVTSLQIPYNATNLDVLNAISGIAGQVTVSSYGLEDQSWLITAATANTALSFGGDSGTLFPTSSVLISTRRFPEADIKAQQIVKIRQSPSIYANNFTPASTAGVISLNNTQQGSATANEVYRLSIGADAIGGNYFIRYGLNSSTAIPIGFTALSVQPILAAISGIGTGNISVADLDGQGGFSIAFTGALAAQNITTALELDSTGIYFAKYYESLVTMGTAELDELFSSSEDLQINPVIEIEVSEASQAQTILQSSARIRKDLISSGAVIPATQESYYTKNEADSIFATIATINLNYYTKLEVDNLLDAITGAPVTGDYYTKAQSDNRYPTTAAISASYYTKTETSNLFVEDSSSNVNATSRWLVNSATQTIIDWQDGLFGYSGVIQVPTASTESGVTISCIVNITTQTVISGNLTVLGTISGSGISVGDVYTKTESDNRYPTTAYLSTNYYTKTQSDLAFVEDSNSNVNATSRWLRNSGSDIMLNWELGSFGYGGAIQVPSSSSSTAITINGTLVINGTATFSGAGGLYYTRFEADDKFVINSITGVSIKQSERTLRDASAATRVSWDSLGVIIQGGANATTIQGPLDVNAGIASFSSYVYCNDGLEIKGDNLSVLSVNLNLFRDSTFGGGQINMSGGNIDMFPGGGVSIPGIQIEKDDGGTPYVLSINPDEIQGSKTDASLDNITCTSVCAAGAVCSGDLAVVSRAGFFSSTPTGRFYSVTATTINTSTAITWSPLQVCSDGTPITLWVLAGTSTAAAPSFLGYDEEVRKITRQVVHVLSQNYFGFVNAVSLTYP